MSVTSEAEPGTGSEDVPSSPGPGRITSVRTAAVVALVAVVLAGGSELSRAGALVALGIVQTALIGTWIATSPAPGRVGSAFIAAGAAGGADAVVTVWPDHGYQPVVGVLGVVVPALFVHQIVRGVVRTRVVESLSSAVLLTVACAAASGVMLLRHQDDGLRWVDAAVLAVGAGVAVQLVVDAMAPIPRFDPAIDRGLLGVVVGTVAGAVVAVALLHDRAGFDTVRAAVAGAGTALVACLVAVGATFALYRPTVDPATVARPVLRWRPIATALATVCLSIPVGYLLVSAFGS